jgi:hypothetical protein
MKVAIVSNFEDRCGNGQYAMRLQAELLKRFDNVDRWEACPEGDYDAVIINWHPPVLGFTREQVDRLRGQGCKVILIVQESQPHYGLTPDSTFLAVDAVVAHEPCVFGGHQPNFRFIHHGAMDCDKFLHAHAVFPMVGTAGFSFRGKRMDITIKAANAIGGRAMLIVPSHKSFDPRPMWEEWKAMIPGDRLLLDTEWHPDSYVIQQLSQCTMNVYAADEGVIAPGQSGSARMLIAARRPTIIRRCRKTSALLPYKDELYFATSEAHVYDLAREIWANIQAGNAVKIPHRVAIETSWSAVGKQFADLVEELVPKAVSA